MRQGNASSGSSRMIIAHEEQRRNSLWPPTNTNHLAAAEVGKPQTPENLAKDQQKRHQKCSVCGQFSSYQGRNLLQAMVEEQQQLPDKPPKYDDFMVQFNSPGHKEEVSFVNPGTAVKTVERCIRRVRKLRYELLQGGVLHNATQKYSAQHPSSARIIAPMLEEEVQVGSLLGSGGFSSVYEITGFGLNAEFSASAHHQSRHHKSSKIRGINALEEQARQCLVSSVRQPARITDDMGPELRSAMQGVSVTSYAIKHLKRGLVKDPAMFQRAALDLAMEAQLLMAMDHPNIVALRGWSHLGVRGLISGTPTGFFVIMDRLPETLEDRIFQWREELGHVKSKLKRAVLFRKQKFFAQMDKILGQRMEVLQQISCALEYMHTLRLLNRDVKATNIGFDNTGVVKLFDFGLSRIMPPAKEGYKDAYLMSRVGTKYYMAPEVHSKDPYNQSADTYSFGIVGWEVMSLCSPRSVLGEYEWQLKAKSQQVPSFIPAQSVLPQCEAWPPLVQDALKACTSMDADRRPSMSQVRQSLELAMNGIGYEKIPDQMPRRSSFRVDLTDGDSSGSDKGSMFGASKGRSDASTVDDHDRVLGSVASSTTGDKGTVSGILTAETKSDTVSIVSRRSSSVSPAGEALSSDMVTETEDPSPNFASPGAPSISAPAAPSSSSTVCSADPVKLDGPSLGSSKSVKSAPTAFGERPRDPVFAESRWASGQRLALNPHGAHLDLDVLMNDSVGQKQEDSDVEMEGSGSKRMQS